MAASEPHLHLELADLRATVTLLHQRVSRIEASGWSCYAKNMSPSSSKNASPRDEVAEERGHGNRDQQKTSKMPARYISAQLKPKEFDTPGLFAFSPQRPGAGRPPIPLPETTTTGMRDVRVADGNVMEGLPDAVKMSHVPVTNGKVMEHLPQFQKLREVAVANGKVMEELVDPADVIQALRDDDKAMELPEPVETNQERPSEDPPVSNIATQRISRSESFIQQDAKTEEWRFEEDSFSTGVIALIKSGLPRAFPQLALSLVTPLLQMICFMAVFDHMISMEFEPQVTLIRVLASAVCFILMGLSLTNEIMEGCRKMIFCCRCTCGQYIDTCPIAAAFGVVLGFLQMCMPCYIVGLSMQLVLGADTVLDAFMNYVALIFITEIDNCLTSSHTLANFFELDCTVKVQLADAAAVRRTAPEPWSMRMLLLSNSVCLAVMPLSVCFVAVASKERAMDLQWWSSQVPAWIILVAVVNSVAWFGGQRLGAVNVAFPLAVISMTILSILFTLHINGEIDWVPLPLSTMLLFTFSTMALPTAAGLDSKPQDLLQCPLRLPLLSWIILAGCTTWTWHFNKFQYA